MTAPTPVLRHARFFLAISMLVMGACGIIYEYTLSVLGNNLMGSSHEQIFVIIGIMLFAMGIGANVQQRLVGKLISRFLLFEILLGLLGGVSTVLIYWSFVNMASYQLVLYAFALAIGLLIGMEIPILIRINRDYQKSLRANLSDVLTMDYVGSLIGALLFAYVLVAKVSLGRIAAILGTVNTLIAIAGLLYFWRLLERRSRSFLLLSSLGTLAFLGITFAQADIWLARLEQRCFADPIIHRETSEYQNLILTRRGETLNFYLNGRLQFSSRDEAIYHDFLVHIPMAVAPRRKHVLILGGGDGLALREVLRYSDVETVTLVDLDPAVTNLAATHPDLIRLNQGSLRDPRVETRDPKGISAGEFVTVTRETKLSKLYLDDRHYPLAEVKVLNIDADLFVRDLGQTFDVAILDFPDPERIELAKLFSTDFYRALATRLAPGAVVSVQSTSPYAAKKAYLCIGETLRQSRYRTLPYHAHVPSFGEWGWHLAWQGGPDESEQRRRIDSLTSFTVTPTYLTPEVAKASFAFGRNWVSPDAGEVIHPNTNVRPFIVQYYREGWR